MIALVATFLVAAYLLGPELLSRWVFSFIVPRKNVVQTKGEEITRALIWAALPLVTAIVWTCLWWHHRNYYFGDSIDAVFSGLYSDDYFNHHQQQFLSCSRTVFWLNVSLLWRVYLLVLIGSLLLNRSVSKYRDWKQHRFKRLALWPLARITLPRISEWHLLLSGMLLPANMVELHADVLTKGGTLYQGKIEDKLLGSDGSLQTITLSNPRRFLRDRFHEVKSQSPETKTDNFWRPIQGNLFIIFASEIASMNLRYIEPNLAGPPLTPSDRDVLLHLLQRLTEPTRPKNSER